MGAIQVLLGYAASLILAAGAGAGQIENPHYKSWVSFAPGTSITERTTRVSPNGKVVYGMISTLESVTADEVVLSTVLTNEVNGVQQNKPGEKLHIKHMTDNTIDLQAFAKATPATVTVPAGTFKTKTFGLVTTSGGLAETHSRSWFTFDVPGGNVKTVITYTRSKVTETIELMAMDKK